MSEEQTPGTHARRCFAAAWHAAEQMGWIVDDEVQRPFAACLMVSPRTGYADRVVIAPEAELSNALRRPGRWVSLPQDPPRRPACAWRSTTRSWASAWPRPARGASAR